jgi:SHS2 domain-containing protein
VSGGGFEEVEHTADWALRVHGTDLADLCRQAATGMLQLAGAEPADGPTRVESIVFTEADAEGVLVRWLEEVLYGLEVRRVMPVVMQLRSHGKIRLEGDVTLAPLARLAKAIKAVTFHALKVTPTKNGCEATIVFDV